MIYISIPKDVIPAKEITSVEEALYARGEFQRMVNVEVVSIADHILDNKYDPDEFFCELSGNDFLKLIERDSIPEWITLEQIIFNSNAFGSFDPQTRKWTWANHELRKGTN